MRPLIQRNSTVPNTGKRPDGWHSVKAVPPTMKHEFRIEYPTLEELEYLTREEAVMPTPVTPMPDNYNTLQLKADFYKNVIDLGNGTVRFVAKMNDPYNQNYNPTNTGKLFVPTSPTDDFDLVLSLATDGAHYLTVDWDKALPAPAAFVRIIGPWTAFQHNATNIIITPSTTNSHIWGRNPLSWVNMLGILKNDDVVANPKYAKAAESKGYAALRPPWQTKDGVRETTTSADRFRNFTFGTGTPPPKGESWEDVFGDDE